MCPFGFKCRFLASHSEKIDSDLGLTLVEDLEKLRLAAPQQCTTDDERRQWVYTTRGEMNVVNMEAVRSAKAAKGEGLPITMAYLKSIGEPIDTRADRGKKGGKGKHKQAGEELSMDKDTPDVPLRVEEKKKLHFEGQLYMAPLTTVGNLPFRRLCVKYGVDITCGEMGLAQEFLSGNKNEWSLVRRHSSEKTFGVQVCGHKPQTLISATEMIRNHCQDLDFIDVNLGCPIDLVVKKGAGSALLDHASKLGKILKGMNYAAGSVPVTIKMRTGIKTGHNTTHKLMSKAVKEWGVGAVTVGGMIEPKDVLIKSRRFTDARNSSDIPSRQITITSSCVRTSCAEPPGT